MSVRNRKAQSPDFANALGMITKVEAEDPLSKEERSLLRSNALTVEDDPWARLSDEVKQNIMAPTLNPVQLLLIVQQNNTLMQCIDAMEINIDGTGFDIQKDGVEIGKDEDNPAKAFFKTIFPGKTFTQVRRQMRRDKEGCGGAYLEVIRDSNGQIAIADWLDAKLTRLVRLDNPVVVKQTITRGGKELEVEMVVRERRFAQLIGSRVRYFREFGSSRHVNKVTGEWMGPADAKRSVKETDFPKQKMEPAKGRPSEFVQEDGLRKLDMGPGQFYTAPMPDADLRPEKQLDETSESALHGTEVLYFPLKPDVTTMYGVPRWVSQLPSALGSRSAEELNLEYFKHGGVPPMILMLMGGKLSHDSRISMNNYLAAPAKMKQRGVILEVYSTSGAVNAASQVKATIERFGGERQTDSMFEDYDDNCHERVRSAFRLPPLFVGHSEDYSYATAYASYLVAEAQVFKPERDAFDEVINATIMKELFPGLTYRSRDLSIVDIEAQLKGMEMAKDSVEREDWVDQLGRLLSLTLHYQDPADDPHKMVEMQTQMQLLGAKQGMKPDDKSGKSNGAGGNAAPYQNPLMKQDGINKQDAFLRELAVEWAGVLAGDTVRDAGSQGVLKRAVEALPPDVRQLFNAYVAARMVNPTEDPQGVAELLSCAGEHIHNGA